MSNDPTTSASFHNTPFDGLQRGLVDSTGRIEGSDTEASSRQHPERRQMSEMASMDGISEDGPAHILRPTTTTIPSHDETEHEETAAAANRNEERQLENKFRQKKRFEFLDDLLRNFDIAIYCELSIVYYLDCSFLRFLLRAFAQFFYLTPKPAIFPEAPKNRPYVGAILTTNALCIILHILLSPPEAGEATRGYLHGGFIIDFIGQKGPASKIVLVVLDILILFLQLFMLSTFIEQQHFKDSFTSNSTSTTPPGNRTAAPTTTSSTTSPTNQRANRQTLDTLDAEERGISTSDVEMQNLSSTLPSSSQPAPPEPSSSSTPASSSATSPSTSHETPSGRTGGDQDGERDELLAEPSPDAGTFSSYDAYTSGEAVIADLCIFDTIRNRRRLYERQNQDSSATATPLGNSSSSSFPAFSAGGARNLSFAERLARARQQRTRLGIRVRIAGRDVATL